MHKYYFKIKKNDTELEFSTDSLEDFDKKVLLWVENICQAKKNEIVTPDDNIQKPKRMDFIEIRDLVKINEINKVENEKEQETDKKIDFEQILEKSINNPKIDLEVKHEESELEKLIKTKNIKNSQDNLIITAFYMLHFKNILRFSIKQVNRRLVPINEEPVTHKIIQEAINNKFIELVPDFTGLGDTTEYSLTQRGEEYYYNEL